MNKSLFVFYHLKVQAVSSILMSLDLVNDKHLISNSGLKTLSKIYIFFLHNKPQSFVIITFIFNPNDPHLEKRKWLSNF